MKQKVLIADNPLDFSTWQEHETEDIHALLKSVYPKFPPTCRIYAGKVSHATDITPKDEASALALGSVTEKLYVVTYPAWEQVAISAAIFVVAWVITELTTQKAPKPREQTFAQGSPNNALSERSNRARLMERVPDILGVVRSVPDLIMWTYRTWEDSRLVEYSWMCIGRGTYGVSDIREGDTLFSQIQQASAEVYPPGQVPGTGTPQSGVGDAITEGVYNVYPVRAINGQQLPPINATYCYGSGRDTRQRSVNVFFDADFVRTSVSTGIILVPCSGDPENVRTKLRIGDHLQVIWGVLGAGLGPIPNLSAGFFFAPDPSAFTPGVGIPLVRGDLEPLTVTNLVTRNPSSPAPQEVEVHVSIPTSLQAEWSKIPGYSALVDSVTGFPLARNRNCAISAQNRWLLGYDETQTDPASRGIFIDDAECKEVWMNFVAPQGLYIEDGANRKVWNQTVSWKLQPCDAAGIPTADPPEFGAIELTGSVVSGETRGVTAKHVLTTPGRCLLVVGRTSIRLRQVDLQGGLVSPVTRYFRTETWNLNFLMPGDGADGDPFPETAFTGSIVDDIQFTECYSMSPLVAGISNQFTTIHSRVVANETSVRVTDRELNCLAFRETNAWNGVAFTTPVASDVKAENLLFHVMKDPFIGNRSNNEIDFVGIAAACQAVRDYFGDEAATDFSYTLDDHNMSFEETVLLICRACFLTPYRQGNVIKCDPDIATDNAVCLFNHRNKLPGSENRQHSFGLLNDSDGVEQQYVDPTTGIADVVPISQFLSQPEVVQPVQSRVVGLRFKQQAWWHAYRQLMRLIHQTESVEFDALNEAGLLGLNHRIFVEDNTDPEMQDGEIVQEDGLVLRTSQPVVDAPSSTYTLMLQSSDGTVQLVEAAPGTPDGHSITIATAPATPVIVNSDNGRRTTYILSRNQDRASKAFLVTEKTSKQNKIFGIQAVNYSHMYYLGDALNLWIVPSTEIGGEEMFDRSPYEFANLADNTWVGGDPVWGPVVTPPDGFFTNNNLFANTLAYTKMCWVEMNPGEDTGTILGSALNNMEIFGLQAGSLVAGHSAGLQCVRAVTGGVEIWRHYAVTYDSLTATLTIYLDGEVFDIATSVPTITLQTRGAFSGATLGLLNCSAKHLKQYSRAFTPSMIRETYQKELLQP